MSRILWVRDALYRTGKPALYKCTSVEKNTPSHSPVNNESSQLLATPLDHQASLSVSPVSLASRTACPLTDLDLSLLLIIVSMYVVSLPNVST